MSDRLSLIGRELNDGGQRWNRRVLYDDALWVRQDDADRALAEVTSLAAQQHAGAVAFSEEELHCLICAMAGNFPERFQPIRMDLLRKLAKAQRTAAGGQ